jgi:hypothetical protein
VFDDQRLLRVERRIWVASDDYDQLACARCKANVDARDIALFSRTRPGDPFDPWCSECAYELVRWAGAGALAANVFETPEAASKMRTLLKHGQF